jgi:FtsH-binding integral membrane protein
MITTNPMNSKTTLMILSAYNAAVGLLLFFAAAVIAKQALPLASDEVLDIAAGNIIKK